MMPETIIVVPIVPPRAFAEEAAHALLDPGVLSLVGVGLVASVLALLVVGLVWVGSRV